MPNRTIVLSVCVLIASGCDSPDIDTSREAFPNGAIVTPENRIDPGGERIVGEPDDDPSALVGAWRLAAETGAVCALILERLNGGRDGRGEVRAQGCAGAYGAITQWRIGPPPVGTRSIVFLDSEGVRVWGGVGLAEGAYRGPDVNGAMAALTRP